MVHLCLTHTHTYIQLIDTKRETDAKRAKVQASKEHPGVTPKLQMMYFTICRTKTLILNIYEWCRAHICRKSHAFIAFTYICIYCHKYMSRFNHFTTKTYIFTWAKWERERESESFVSKPNSRNKNILLELTIDLDNGLSHAEKGKYWRKNNIKEEKIKNCAGLDPCHVSSSSATPLCTVFFFFLLSFNSSLLEPNAMLITQL